MVLACRSPVIFGKFPFTSVVGWLWIGEPVVRADLKVVDGRPLFGPTGKFGPQDANIIGSLKSEPNSVAFDFGYSNADAVAGDNLLAAFPGQNKHGNLLEGENGSNLP